MISVTISVTSLCPTRAHLAEPDAIHFQATEVIDGTTSRGDYTETVTSMLRPLLDWNTRVDPIC